MAGNRGGDSVQGKPVRGRTGLARHDTAICTTVTVGLCEDSLGLGRGETYGCVRNL